MRAAIFFLVLLIMPSALASNIRIEAPSQFVENESAAVHFVVNSSIQFAGSVAISFSNIESGATSFSFTESNLAGGFYNYSTTVKATSGMQYQINATLSNSSHAISSSSKSGTINSSVPFVVTSGPSGIVSKDSAMIFIRTNEITTCKLDSSNLTYSNMTITFTNTNSHTHNHTLTSLSQGEKRYYIRCKDQGGYQMQDSHTVIFTVDLAPSAEIELSDESPVRQGVVEIELTVSEPVEVTPLLEYQFNDGTSKKQISLSGSGSRWMGFLVISDLDDGKIGTFYFSAQDSASNTGTKITSGNIFVVDTKAPSPPSSLKATAESDGRIKLSWYYRGEEADYFRIYRSTSPSVNYVDYLAESNGSMHYTDRSTLDKVTYYYKITTVDRAGNEGSLSEEVYATSVREGQDPEPAANQDSPQIKRVLPPNLHPFVEDAIKKVETMIIDVDAASEIIESVSSEEKEILKEINAKQTIDSAKLDLQSSIKRLELLKEEYASEQEILSKIEEINRDVKRVEKTTPKGARLVEKSDFQQTVSKDDIASAVNEAFSDGSLSQEEKDSYVKRSDKEKDKVEVETSVRVYELTFLDDSKSQKSRIEKKIIYSGKQRPEDVLVIETVPKSIAADASEIDFGSQLAEILENDPVIKFGFHEFREQGERIYYYLDKKINADDVKNTKTVFLLGINSFVSSNSLTGNSIFSLDIIKSESLQTVLAWVGATLLLGIFGYYYLFVKDSGYGATKFRRSWTIRKLERESQEDAGQETKGKTFQNYSNHDHEEIFDELSSHMKEVKADIADKLLPLFVALNQKMESKKSSAPADDYHVLLLNALIDQAHGYIDNGLHSEAVKIYPRISELYQRLSKGQRNEIFQRCTHLHRRIHFKRPF